MRIRHINGITEEVISKKNKEEYLTTLKKYIKIFLGSMGFSLISLVLAKSSFGMIPPVISTIITSKFLYTLIDEIEEFDIEQKDIDLLKEFQKKIEEDKKKKEELQKEKLEKLKKNAEYLIEKTYEAKQNKKEGISIIKMKKMKNKI